MEEFVDPACSSICIFAAWIEHLMKAKIYLHKRNRFSSSFPIYIFPSTLSPHRPHAATAIDSIGFPTLYPAFSHTHSA
ncbi:uncharacterized protein VTP21DRAFT_10183 [Calcarisporiella thermophila]|uniref:uncharacterized protein n=1 Tax=Calcarisporiella thermophila TaxID=911321 RepID=UPI0037439A76